MSRPAGRVVLVRALVVAGVLVVFRDAAIGSRTAVAIASVVGALVVLGVGALALRLPRLTRRRAADEVGEAGRRQWSSLYQLESAVLIAMQSRHHFDSGLRPRLQRVAVNVARGRRGMGWDGGRGLIGEELWPLLDPDRPASRDDRPGGMRIASLECLLDRIERL